MVFLMLLLWFSSNYWNQYHIPFHLPLHRLLVKTSSPKTEMKRSFDWVFIICNSSIISWGWGRTKEDIFHYFKFRPLVRTTFAHSLFLMIIQIFYWCLRPKIKFSNNKNSASVHVIFPVMLQWAEAVPLNILHLTWAQWWEAVAPVITVLSSKLLQAG